jgi:hypothetical protein
MAYGSKAKAPPPPDYSGIAAASEKSATMAFELGQEQLAWAKETYANDRELLDRIVNAAEERQSVNDADARKDRERYEQIFQPLEDKMAQDALDYASPERTQMEMERSQATVAQQFEAQRRAATQNLESFGIDPSSTRFAALDAGSRVAGAAAAAGAGNQSRAQTEAIGRALQSEAVNVGRGYPGQVAGTYATALQSGNQAASSQLAGTASGASTMGTGTQWAGMGNQALNTWGNTLNMGYNNQLAAADFNSRQSSGLGTLAGIGAGLINGTTGAGGLTGLAAFGFNKGGAVPAIPDGVTSGGNVPNAASPTGGRAIDDVDAKLTAGEFVVPKDVVSWKGEEFFQRLIDGSRKAKPQASAQPEYTNAPQGAPTFASRPTAALPMG